MSVNISVSTGPSFRSSLSMKQTKHVRRRIRAAVRKKGGGNGNMVGGNGGNGNMVGGNGGNGNMGGGIGNGNKRK